MPASDRSDRSDDHFSAVLTVREYPSNHECRYHVTILRQNGQVANTGLDFHAKDDAHHFIDGLDTQARIMSNGKTRVLLDELTASESVDFWLAGKIGPLTAPQVASLEAVKAGNAYAGLTTAGEITRRSRVLDRMIARRYVTGHVSIPPVASLECASLFLTSSGERALKNAIGDETDGAVGLDRLNPPGLR